MSNDTKDTVVDLEKFIGYELKWTIPNNIDEIPKLIRESPDKYKKYKKGSKIKTTEDLDNAEFV